MTVRACRTCGRSYPMWGLEVACTCGSPLSWAGAAECSSTAAGLWRHADILPPVSLSNRLTLGEVATPLIDVGRLRCKLDYMLPTGSFKDRGACVLASAALESGVEHAVADSSGNAGAALAAYCAAGGLPLTVFVPKGTGSPKVAQIRRYGATVEEVDGDRAAVSAAARRFAETSGAFYASHAWSPFFLAGVRTVALELVDALGDEIPGVVCPVGAGTLLLGLYQGFQVRLEQGRITRIPPLHGIQAALVAPLAAAFAAGSDDVDADLHSGKSIAEGINTATPPRAREILAAVRASGGSITAVREEEIVDPQEALARRGVLVEKTSAVAWAGALDLPALPDGSVAVLTGSGLKEAA
jgi:threonine synthase